MTLNQEWKNNKLLCLLLSIDSHSKLCWPQIVSWRNIMMFWQLPNRYLCHESHISVSTCLSSISSGCLTDNSNITSPDLSFLSSPQTQSFPSLPHKSKWQFVLPVVQSGHLAVPFDSTPFISNPSTNVSSFCIFPESDTSHLTLCPQTPLISHLGYSWPETWSLCFYPHPLQSTLKAEARVVLLKHVTSPLKALPQLLIYFRVKQRLLKQTQLYTV